MNNNTNLLTNECHSETVERRLKVFFFFFKKKQNSDDSWFRKHFFEIFLKKIN